MKHIQLVVHRMNSWDVEVEVEWLNFKTSTKLCLLWPRSSWWGAMNFQSRDFTNFKLQCTRLAKQTRAFACFTGQTKSGFSFLVQFCEINIWNISKTINSYSIHPRWFQRDLAWSGHIYFLTSWNLPNGSGGQPKPEADTPQKAAGKRSLKGFGKHHGKWRQQYVISLTQRLDFSVSIYIYIYTWLLNPGTCLKLLTHGILDTKNIEYEKMLDWTISNMG